MTADFPKFSLLDSALNLQKSDYYTFHHTLNVWIQNVIVSKSRKSDPSYVD